ncbi:MAG: peptidylprolyl isomerase [Alphaproteobacteria bacterium]
MHINFLRQQKLWQGLLAFIFLNFIALAGVNCYAAENNQTVEKNMNPETTLVIELKYGKVYIEMYPDKAPEHVKRISELASKGFYDGIVFHRVIAGFMAQTGDPSGTGMGGSDEPDLKAEFNDVKHIRGTASMARSRNPDSANSQFFICLEPAPHLDGQYTVWGQVIEGMEFVDQIKKGDPYSGKVDEPDKMIKVRLLKDME